MTHRRRQSVACQEFEDRPAVMTFCPYMHNRYSIECSWIPGFGYKLRSFAHSELKVETQTQVTEAIYRSAHHRSTINLYKKSQGEYTQRTLDTMRISIVILACCFLDAVSSLSEPASTNVWKGTTSNYLMLAIF